MRTHIENIHSPKTLKCEHCGKTFTNEKYLKQHTQTHSHEYVCPLCPEKTFSLTTTLRAHMKTSHPKFPLPFAGTKLKNYDWSRELNEFAKLEEEK